MPTTGGWQKLKPTSSSTDETATTYRRQLSSQVSTSDAMLQSASMVRLCSWPRHCMRFIIYASAFAFITTLFGFFIAAQRSPSTTTDYFDVESNNKAIAFQRPIDVTHRHHAKLDIADPSLRDLLDKTRVPNVVHYVWCEAGYFEFKHYVSVQSAIKFLRPDLVVVHLTNEPIEDPLGYNDWWKRLKADVQNLIIDKVPSTTNCSEDESLADEIFANNTKSQGGIYLANGVILTKSVALKLPAEEESMTFEYPESVAPSSGLARKLPAVWLFRPNADWKGPGKTRRCSSIEQFDSNREVTDSPCVVYHSEKVPLLYPRDIWESPKPFGSLTRALAYDTSDILAPVPNPNTLIPLICHYLWLGGGTMEYLLYLSILSCLNVLKADAVLIHGELEPQGPLWKELLALGDSRLSYVYRPQQVTMYGTPVKKLAAMSDVLRTDILLKYGGIYTDWDAVWVKPLDAEIRSYDAVVAPDWPSKLKPFPDTLNLGVMLAKPGSAYVKHLQEGMAEYADGVGPLDWCFICLRAYKVLERYPETALLEPHLQVMAYLGRYHPQWQEGAGDDHFDGTFDWQTETYAVHWTFPTPKELRSKTGLAKSNSTAANIARFILKTSGLN